MATHLTLIAQCILSSLISHFDFKLESFSWNSETKNLSINVVNITMIIMNHQILLTGQFCI